MNVPWLYRMQSLYTIIFLIILGLSSPTLAFAQIVNVYNWANFISPSTTQSFEEKTHIKVQYDVFDQNHILESKLIAGGSGYDVVAPTSGPYFEKHIRWHLYKPLDKSLLPNYHHLDPAIMKLLATVDIDNRFGVPWMWGTVGIGYNKDKIAAIMPDAPLDSLDLIFNPEIVSKFASCGIAMIDTPTDVLPSAQLYAGYEPNDPSEEAMEAGKKTMLAIRPYISQFSESKYIDDLANGDACLVFGLSADIAQAKMRAEEAENDIHIGFSHPKEGTQVWIDMLTIPRDAKHILEAHAFINYLLNPQIAAINSNEIGYANANTSSVPLLQSSIRDNPMVYTPINKLPSPFMVRSVSANLDRKRSRIWLHVLKGK